MRPAMCGSTTRSASPRRVTGPMPRARRPWQSPAPDAVCRWSPSPRTSSSAAIASTPYVESDPSAPLNVYGRSKAEAEARVLEALPSALVVRTGAFFGPWDEHNFVTIALRTLAAGHPFVAAEDAFISPTYVPDLVHASLDLLIDGERGIWHLANVAAISWADLARRAAERVGLDPAGVEGRPTAALGLAAPRPPWSVLGSERGDLLPSLDDALGRFLCNAKSIGPIGRSAPSSPPSRGPVPIAVEAEVGLFFDGAARQDPGVTPILRHRKCRRWVDRTVVRLPHEIVSRRSTRPKRLSVSFGLQPSPLRLQVGPSGEVVDMAVGVAVEFARQSGLAIRQSRRWPLPGGSIAEARLSVQMFRSPFLDEVSTLADQAGGVPRQLARQDPPLEIASTRGAPPRPSFARPNADRDPSASSSALLSPFGISGNIHRFFVGLGPQDRVEYALGRTGRGRLPARATPSGHHGPGYV